MRLISLSLTMCQVSERGSIGAFAAAGGEGSALLLRLAAGGPGQLREELRGFDGGFRGVIQVVEELALLGQDELDQVLQRAHRNLGTG